MALKLDETRNQTFTPYHNANQACSIFTKTLEVTQCKQIETFMKSHQITIQNETEMK